MRKLTFVFICCWNLLFLSPLHASQQEELYSAASRAFDDGFYDVAIRYLEQFNEQYPQDAKALQARFLLGQCYFFKNRFSESLNTFHALVDRYENKELLLYWIAEVHLKIPDYAQAQKHYMDLINTYPNSAYLPQTYYSLAWSYFDQKKYDLALETFTHLATIYPKNPLSEDATLKIAQCLFNKSDYRGALVKFLKYLTAYPQSERQWDVYLNMADAYYYIKDYENSKSYYEKACKSPEAKGALSAYTGRIWCYLKLKDFNSAEKCLKEAQEFSKGKGLSDDDLLLVKANIFLEKDDLSQAISAYDELIKSSPRGPHYLEAHLGRANANFLLKKYSEALGDYSFIVDRGDKEDVSLKANLGIAWTYAKLNDMPSAIERFRTIADQASKVETKVTVLIQMADALADAGNAREAVNVYDQIIKDYPDNPLMDYVQFRQGIGLLKTGKTQAAVVVFENLRVNFPKSIYLQDVSYYLGIAAFKMGDFKKSMATINDYLKNLSGQSDFMPEANYILALSYLNLKQPEDALKIFQKILRLYPEDLEVTKNSDIGIAKCQYELGLPKEAVKRFKMIVFKYPKTEAEFESLLWLAQYYLKNGEYALAIDYYQQILERYAEHSGIEQIYYEIGQTYEIQGQYDHALAAYKRIPSKSPALYSKAKLAIAGIFAKEFDAPKATQAYTNISETSPDLARESYLRIAQLYRNSQNYAKELECYQKALLAPLGNGQVLDAELLFDIADTYEVMGRLNEAVDIYLKIPAQYAKETLWVLKAYLRVAKIFEDRKDWSGAKITYQKIIQLDVEESKFAQERLDWINTHGGNKK